MSRVLLVLIAGLVLLNSGAAYSFGSRSILRAIGDEKGDSHDYAVVLNATNFGEVLADSPAPFAIVEFFAHWCPACRNYKPQYEKVARLFNGHEAVHPGMVLMTRVDCALKINTNLCDKFSVNRFPMLFWGPPSKFVSSGWDPKEGKSEISYIDDGRTADRLLNWINKKMGSAFGLDDKKFENEHMSLNASDPEQVGRAVFDIEEATTTAFDIILAHKMIKSETRASFLKFLQLIVAHHPSKRCRKGSAEILINFNDLWPLDTFETEKQGDLNVGIGALKIVQICGKDIPRGYWMFCRGSRSDTRGFSCGLWVLLHSLSVRIEDGESQFAFTTICDFVHNFFICEECRQHFHEICSRVSTPINKARDFALWLWQSHNEVNERLAKEEENLGTGDPKFPKMIWPPKQLCPSCHQLPSENTQTNQIIWNEDEVYKFLSNYYGSMLLSLYKKKAVVGNDESGGGIEDLVPSTNAVVVPVGAALAIAFAGCVFGALACYWRMQQKSRKYFHHRYSLKKYDN